MSQLSNGDIRELILRFLYSTHERARGVRSTAIEVSKIKRVLKKEELKEREIASNLDYLIQRGWVLEEQEEYSFSRRGRTIRAQRVSYNISDKGMNHFQGPSKF